MSVSSFFHPCDPNEHFQFWEHEIGRNLPQKIAQILSTDFYEHKISSSNYMVNEFSDISYCQLFSIPQKRPAKFVYAFLSDYINNENKCKTWIETVKPNLFCCLQHCPQELIEIGKRNNCLVKLIPWFVNSVSEKNEKDVLAMCSGCIDPGIYPSRYNIFHHLKSLNNDEIILSGSKNFGKYPLSNNEYESLIKRTKYYLSGGIYDRFVPPKYYEVASHGACIISFDMEYMSTVGFEHMNTCIIIKDLNEIQDILKSDLYKIIGEKARQMVKEKHTITQRAEEIIESTK